MTPKHYAVIRNRESNKDVAVLIHEPKIGRVVFKCREADWPLQQAFNVWVDRTLIVQEPMKVKDSNITVRKKITRFDDRYMAYLLDRMVKRPYEVRSIHDSNSTIRLDDFADKMSAEVM